MKTSLALLLSLKHLNSTKRTSLLLSFALLATLGFSQNADSLATVRQLDSLRQVTNDFFNTGKFEEGLPIAQKAVELAKDRLGQNHPKYAREVNTLADFYERKGMYSRAEAYYLEAKEVQATVLGKESPDYAKTLNSLGYLYEVMGRYVEAEPLYVEAKNILEKTLGREHSQYAVLLSDLGSLYRCSGLYGEAELLLLEAKNIAEKVLGHEHHNYASFLNHLALLYYDMGRYVAAEPLYVEAKNIWEKTVGREHPQYAVCLNNLAMLYHTMGRYVEAEPLYVEAKNIKEKTVGHEHPRYAIGLNNLAMLYHAMGRYVVEEPLLIEAKNIWEKTQGREHPQYALSLNNLALLYHALGRDVEAEPLFVEAKNIWEKTQGREHPQYALSLNNLTHLYWTLSRYSEVEPLLVEESFLQKNRLTNAARHLSEKELKQYVDIYARLINIPSSFTLQQASTAGRLPEVCFDNALFHKGFLLQTAAEIKSRALTDTATARRFALLTDYRRRLGQEYNRSIAQRNQPLMEYLEPRANTLEKELARMVSGYEEAYRIVRWQEVQATLKPGEAAVEFIHYRYVSPRPTDSIFYSALVLRPGDTQPHFIPLFEEKNLKTFMGETAVRRMDYVANLYQSSPARGITSDSAKSLYELIWAPLQPELKGVKTVCYSPSGILHRLNMGAVAINEDSLLSDRYELVRLGSTRQLVSAPTTIATTTATAIVYGGVRFDMDSMAIGAANAVWSHEIATNRGELSFTYSDSTLRGGSWKYLPWTEKEVTTVASILTDAGIPATVKKGYAATEESFKQIGNPANGGAPRILHISTHGFFFPDPKDTVGSRQFAIGNNEPVFKISDHPMIRSGLILAGANHAWQTGKPLKPDMDDGILTAYEISQMNLSGTELVVLSACETGLGDIAGNEGVYGLQRAFKIAGVRYLIMSLWQVPDFQTQELMSAFYGKWLKERLPVRQALESAQQEMRQKGFDPFYWAGFVLVE